MDLTFSTELRSLREQQIARWADSDAKWERRLAELDTKWERRLAELDIKWTERWTAVDAKFDRHLERLKSELLRWMFGFWVSTLIGLGALFLRR